MFGAARVPGSTVRRVYEQDGPSLKAAGIDFNAGMIFGGRIRGEAARCEPMRKIAQPREMIL